MTLLAIKIEKSTKWHHKTLQSILLVANPKIFQGFLKDIEFI